MNGKLLALARLSSGCWGSGEEGAFGGVNSIRSKSLSVPLKKKKINKHLQWAGMWAGWQLASISSSKSQFCRSS